uniref:Uncharacterized protein n=1 Tax=Ditylum brightwellii TaxID=49249 RepID=A0A7S1ZSW5_9STRA
MIEIRFKLTPCIEGAPLSCDFNIKRERQGRHGFIIPLGSDKHFRPGKFDCPSPKWCDDDNNGDSDEDRKIDPHPKCTIFVVDGPGILVDDKNTCGLEGGLSINQFNFREWLAVGGELPMIKEETGDYVMWHASTRLLCVSKGGGLIWTEDADGLGNVVGKDAYKGNIENLGSGVIEGK